MESPNPKLFDYDLEPVRVNHTARNLVIVVMAVVLVVALLIGYRLIPKGDAVKGSAANPVKIGVVGATDPHWIEFKQLAESNGIHVDIIDFQDYTSENPAVATGELDLNQFQHLLYLADYNVKNNQDLQPIGATAIYPLGVYSEQYDDINAIEYGKTVAIPNDETNQARAIGVLNAAGLVTMKDEWNPFVTPQDIDEAASKVKVVALKAEQVANALKDPQIAAGVINNDYIADAGINPQDAIYKDDAQSEEARPYINVFVTRKADADNELYRQLVSLYQSQQVLDTLQKQFAGTAVLATDFTADELQRYLADIEDDMCE